MKYKIGDIIDKYWNNEYLITYVIFKIDMENKVHKDIYKSRIIRINENIIITNNIIRENINNHIGSNSYQSFINTGDVNYKLNRKSKIKNILDEI